MRGHQFNCKQISEQEHQRISQNTQKTPTLKHPETETILHRRKADTTDGKKKSAASDGAFSTHKY